MGIVHMVTIVAMVLRSVFDYCGTEEVERFMSRSIRWCIVFVYKLKTKEVKLF